jgi:hypothetical protein
MASNAAAECLHVEPKHIPLLTPGEILPMVLREWDMACDDFFTANHKIEAAQHVGSVLPGLKDMRVWDWIATHHDCLSALSFAAFMKVLRKEFLPEGWEEEYHSKIANTRLRSSDSFPAWLNNVCLDNFAL